MKVVGKDNRNDVNALVYENATMGHNKMCRNTVGSWNTYLMTGYKKRKNFTHVPLSFLYFSAYSSESVLCGLCVNPFLFTVLPKSSPFCTILVDEICTLS